MVAGQLSRPREILQEDAREPGPIQAQGIVGMWHTVITLGEMYKRGARTALRCT